MRGRASTVMSPIDTSVCACDGGATGGISALLSNVVPTVEAPGLYSTRGPPTRHLWACHGSTHQSRAAFIIKDEWSGENPSIGPQVELEQSFPWAGPRLTLKLAAWRLCKHEQRGKA